ncbi:MAG: radical SAM protein [Myxococcota bacterium]
MTTTSNYGRWKARAASAGRPTTAHLELTYRCNVQCRHCFQDRHHAKDAMALEDWKRVVDEAREAGVLVVTLSGGEALLSPHFWPLAEHIRARGLAFRVFTNGVLLNKRNCRRLAALQPLSVEVSIFSLDPAVHDGVTQAPGSLRKALRGLAMLHYLGVTTKLKCPLLDTSTKDYADVRALAERLGASVAFDPGITPRFNGDLAPTACRGDEHFLVEFFRDPQTRHHELKDLPPRKPGDAICGIARTFTVVGPDGRVLPCVHIQQPVGNVKQEGLLRIWEHSPTLQKLRQTTYADLPTCNGCPRSGYCGRCSAVALLEDGDFHGPSSRACELAELKEQAWGVPPPAGVREKTGTTAGKRLLQVLR